MKNKSVKQIVEENFKGLDELIEDKDLLLFYKELIEDCIKGYHEQFKKKKVLHIEKSACEHKRTSKVFRNKKVWKLCIDCGEYVEQTVL